jgi:hypothetical protein
MVAPDLCRCLADLWWWDEVVRRKRTPPRKCGCATGFDYTTWPWKDRKLAILTFTQSVPSLTGSLDLSSSCIDAPWPTADTL